MFSVNGLRSPIYAEGLEKPRDLNDGVGFDLFFSDEYKKKFIVFLHEFVMCMLELPKVKKQMIMGKDSILDLTSASDEALAVLFYVNNHEKWTKKHQHKDDPEHQGNNNTGGGVFSNTRGKGRFRMGWTEDGMSLFHGAENFFKKAREKTDDWEKLKISCRTYFATTMRYRHGRRTMRNKNQGESDGNSELDGEYVMAPELDGIALDFYQNEDYSNSNSERDEGDVGKGGENDDEEGDKTVEESEAMKALMDLDGGYAQAAVKNKSVF